MRTSRIAFALAAAVAMTTALTGSAHAQSTPTEQDIIDALKKRSDDTGEFSRVRSLSGDRGVSVTGGKKAVPSIDLKVNFAFDSARLDNESLLTLGCAWACALQRRPQEPGHRSRRSHRCEGHDRIQRRAVAATSRSRCDLHRPELHAGSRPDLVEGNGRAPVAGSGQRRSRDQPARRDSECDASAVGLLPSQRLPKTSLYNARLNSLQSPCRPFGLRQSPIEKKRRMAAEAFVGSQDCPTSRGNSRAPITKEFVLRRLLPVSA